MAKVIQVSASESVSDELIVVGVDIGGSHVTAAAVNLETRSIVQGSWIRERVNSQSGCESIIARWTKAISHAASSVDKQVYRVGLGLPGPFDYEKGISLIQGQEKYDKLYGLNIKALLSDSLGIEEENIKMMNDAACFLKGEAFAGAGIGFNKTVGITLGTGLGSAVCELELVKDLDLWNSPFEDTIAEDYLSTRWFVNRYEKLSGEKIDDVLSLSMMASGDSNASQVFKEFGKNLGHFLSSLIRSQNPDAIILGGNISQAFPLFGASLLDSLSGAGSVAIRAAMLGEGAAIIGASSLWCSSVSQNEKYKARSISS